MPSLFDLDQSVLRTFEEDRKWLKETDLPVVTVAGRFLEDLKRVHGLPDNNTSTDVVLSRAHFSMPVGLLIQAWGGLESNSTAETAKLHKTSWLIDPTNYVTRLQLKKIWFTELVGKTLARKPILKKVKDFIDQFGRSKLPIVSSITPPLLYITEEVNKPIISFHIAAGNILAEHGRYIVQVVTDPHVRPEYTFQAHRPNTKYCVFDERTKIEFLEEAAIQGIKVDPEKVIVTGPPVDPRIVAARERKAAWRSGPLNICITTGGLGTNKNEIRHILKKLLPHLHSHKDEYRFLVYAGTQKDIAEMVQDIAREEHVRIGKLNDTDARLRLIYHPQLFDSNEMLIKYAFRWAHGFITKPSGDMAYDAVAAGCFILTLQSWGVWEDNVRETFEQKDIGRIAEVEHIMEQLHVLQQAPHGHSWIEQAMNKALSIEKLFLMGNKKIIRVAEDWRDELAKK